MTGMKLQCYHISAYDRNDTNYPFVDGSKFWINARSDEEAKRRVQIREDLTHHDIVITSITEARSK